MVMFISAAYNPEIVLIAATFTATVAVALTIYAFTTKNDFTASGGALAIFLSVFLLLGVMLLFFNTPVAATCYSGIGVIVFGFYLIYDTQLVVGGGQHELCDEDYIIAAMIIYLDIIMIFLHVLEMLSKNK